jgi:GTP-binding protein
LQDIRNIAVIAHVDHGKTTLVDGLLQQSGTFGAHEKMEERAMDSNAIEKERGITILSKNTAIRYKGIKINVIDTPGHADFGGEVERVLKMVDGVLLLVDAQEGVMPQTKFVVKKALALGVKPIVVVNKIDKDAAEPDRVVDEVFDLFSAMDATEDQLDFPVIYAAARDGYAITSLDDERVDLTPLFEAIITHVPKPIGSPDNHTQVQVFTLDYDNYVGKIGIARVFNGKLKKNQNILLVKADGEQVSGRVTKLIGFHGLARMEIQEAEAGDICAVAGFETIDVGDSLCDPANPMPLDPMHIEEPTLSVVFAVNDSPLAGTEGKHVTSNKILERLEKEMQTNIAMRLESAGEGQFKVSGRGELQITVLAENMRREGFEFSISRPEVIIKEENGVKMEPYEHLVVDVPEQFAGSVIEKLGKKKAEMKAMVPMTLGQTRLEFEIPARGLIGMRTQFLTDTKGEGIINHWSPWRTVKRSLSPSLTSRSVVRCSSSRRIKSIWAWLSGSTHAPMTSTSTRSKESSSPTSAPPARTRRSNWFRHAILRWSRPWSGSKMTRSSRSHPKASVSGKNTSIRICENEWPNLPNNSFF